MLTDDEILNLVRECDLDWHAGFSIGDEDNRYARLARAIEAALAAAPLPSDEQIDGMCPNCVTPWKCNGPHYYTAQPSAEPVAWATLVDDAVHDVNLTKIAADLRAQNLREQKRGRDFVMSVAPLYVAPRPSAEPTLVQAARDALACMREYSSKADEDCGDPGCGECHAMRPTWAALDTLRRALDASDGAGDARDAALWETRTELAQVRARVAELEARKP